MASVCDPHQVLLAQVKAAEQALKAQAGPDAQAKLRQLLVLRMRITGLRDESQARLRSAQQKQHEARLQLTGLQQQLRKPSSFGYASQDSTCGDSDGSSDCDSFDGCSVLTEDEMSPAYFRAAGQCVLLVEDRPLFRALPKAQAKGIEVDRPVAPAQFRGGAKPPSPQQEACVAPVAYLPPPQHRPFPATPSPQWASLNCLELPCPRPDLEAAAGLGCSPSPGAVDTRRLSLPLPNAAPAAPPAGAFDSLSDWLGTR